MNGNLTTIKDPTVKFKPSDQLIIFLKENSKNLENKKCKTPDNIKCILKNKKNLLKESDIDWLNKFLSKQRGHFDGELLTGPDLYEEIDKIFQKESLNFDYDGYLNEKKKSLPYLHELLNGSDLILPKNEVVERNPILAERIEKLKKEQEEREYRAMTQNVDTTKKHRPEDNISYQMNMLNRHLIAVAQFLVSVGAGFAFGFLGLELIAGELNFGVRLLLGIICALVIAVAEFYFLAKYLNEEDKEETKPKPVNVTNKGKLHKD